MSKRAIDLLLRAMEARSMSLQTSALHQVSRGATDALITAKLLVPSGHVPVVAAMDDYEDEPVEATWSAELKSYGYHDSTGRWVKVANQEIAACRVDYGLALAKMLLAFERAGPSRPTPLVSDLIWEVGTIKLAGAKAPVPVWFARRLGDPGVWTQFEALIGRKPPQEIRIILTSTPGERIPETAQKRNHIINVADVAGDPAKLAISPQVLGARLFPGQAQRRFPIDHSDDYGIVWLRGETLMHIDLGPARSWGEKFPVRAVPFATEMSPAREVLTESRTLKGAGVAGAATVGAAGVEVAQEVLAEAQGAVLPLVPYLDTLRWLFIALALAGIAVTIWARLDDWQNGMR